MNCHHLMLGKTPLLKCYKSIQKFLNTGKGVAMKTMEKWNESDSRTIHDYLEPGDEIDSEMYDYFLGVVPPAEVGDGYFLVGEPYDENEFGYTFDKFEQRGDKFFYVGLSLLKGIVSRNLIFHTDPGHGWLEVQYTDLLKLGIDQEISYFSYSHQGCVYLEEDCDAGVFMDAAKAAGWEIKITERHEENTPIRNYRSYRR